jgi:hypothetical protein
VTSVSVSDISVCDVAVGDVAVGDIAVAVGEVIATRIQLLTIYLFINH